MSQGFGDIVDALRTELAGVAPLNFGKKARTPNVLPPLYTVYPIRETYPRLQGGGQSTNPRSMTGRNFVCEFHCWGATYHDAEVLMYSMVTALNHVLQGADYQMGTATWDDSVNLDLGYLLVIPITIGMNVPEQLLPVGDNTSPTVVITSTGLDTSGTNPPITAGTG